MIAVPLGVPRREQTTYAVRVVQDWRRFRVYVFENGCQVRVTLDGPDRGSVSFLRPGTVFWIPGFRHELASLLLAVRYRHEPLAYALLWRGYQMDEINPFRRLCRFIQDRTF